MRTVIESKVVSNHKVYFGEDTPVNHLIRNLARKTLVNYRQVLPAMTANDAIDLREYARQYLNIIPEIDEAIGSPLKRAILEKMNKLLLQIGSRTKQ